MMKKNNIKKVCKINKILPIFLTAAISVTSLLFSCSSMRTKEEVFELPDYTLDDVKKEEIKRITQMKENSPVEALWRAVLLGDEETKKENFENVKSLLEKAISEKKYYQALNYYNSIENSGFDVSSISVKKSELESKTMEKVPGINNPRNSAEKISTYVDGTVTVWVDKGVRIQNGVGYADRVIGSGFFISKNGYIVTNHHVIADMVDTKNEQFSRLYVKLANDPDTRIPAKVVGWDPLIDLALLKTEIDAPYVFSLGKSSELEVGDTVFAIGSPIGLDKTITRGIISATDRKLFSCGSVYQIDAAVNSGNSGGPCINEKGEVLCIVFAGMLQFEGLNFAIPVEYLRAELPGLFAGGEYKHPFIASFGHTKKELGKETGVELQYVMPSGSAFRSKLEEGDILTEIDGKKISSFEDLKDVFMSLRQNTIVKGKAKKIDGEKETIKEFSIFLSERPKNPGYQFYKNDIVAQSFIPIFGMKLYSVSTSSSRKYSILSIIKGSVADESGFSETDPIELRRIEFSDDKSMVYSELYTKNRKKGYLDSTMGLTAPLDSPWFF